MDKKLILAVAGSGKTYELCNKIDESKRNLILAYTNENIKNLYYEILKRFNYIPTNTLICTFDYFIYNYIAKQFIKYVAIRNDKNYLFDEYGCVYNLPLPEQYDAKLRKWNNAFADNKLAHYITSTGKFYGERIPKFINKYNLLDIASIPIKEHFDNIFIDEIQDFAGERFELLKNLILVMDNIYMVGDYYQHSVSNTIEFKKQPFLKNITYAKYKKEFINLNVNVDEISLGCSRRCSKEVCEYIKSKLDINIVSLETNTGKVYIIKNIQEAEKILHDNDIIKLVYSNANKFNFKAVNWGYSKGDTFNTTCVILNKNMKGFENNIEKINIESEVIKNKLYVALSRTKGDLYILPYAIFKQTKYNN